VCSSSVNSITKCRINFLVCAESVLCAMGALLATKIRALESIFNEDLGATGRTRVPDSGWLGADAFKGMLSQLVPTSTTAAASVSKSASIAAMTRFSAVSCPVRSQLRSKWTAIGLLLDWLKLFFFLRFRIGVGAITNSVRTQRNDDVVLCVPIVCANWYLVDKTSTMGLPSPISAQFEQTPMRAAIRTKIYRYVDSEFSCFTKVHNLVQLLNQVKHS
jgi:hypothetical protein